MEKLLGIAVSVIVLLGMTSSSPGLIKNRVDFEVRIGSRILGDFVVTKNR